MSSTTANIRTSNIELLRIIAMMMIVSHHMLVQGVSQIVGAHNLFLNLTDNLLIYGVNIFLLISGYFLIKFSWKKLFNLLWICSFYKIFHLFFRLFVLSDPQTLIAWIGKPIGVLFSTGGWFMDIYLLLFLLSLIVNKALYSMTNREYKIGLIIILAVNICWGWIKGDGINPNGYTISQFIMMYYIGFGCKKCIDTNISQRRFFNISTLSVALGMCAFCSLLLTIVLHGTDLCGKLYDYNNPLVIIGSLLIFLLFLRIKPFTSKKVNFIAVSVFPVYLVHHQGGFVDWYMNIVANTYTSYSLIAFIGLFVLQILLLFLFTITIDQIRKYLSPYIVDICIAIERRFLQPLINRL